MQQAEGIKRPCPCPHSPPHPAHLETEGMQQAKGVQHSLAPPQLPEHSPGPCQGGRTELAGAHTVELDDQTW